MLRRQKASNPFKQFQKERVENNTAKIKGAIETLRSAKADITYSGVARLTQMTLSGLRRNSQYVMLIETAKARLSPHIKNSQTPEAEEPRTLDDALSLIRILRAKNRSLSNKLSIQARVFKHYKIKLLDRDYVAIPTEEAVRRLNHQPMECLRRIIELVLEDKVYQITSEGIVNGFHQLVVPKALLQAANLYLGEKIQKP